FLDSIAEALRLLARIDPALVGRLRHTPACDRATGRVVTDERNEPVSERVVLRGDRPDQVALLRVERDPVAVLEARLDACNPRGDGAAEPVAVEAEHDQR